MALYGPILSSKAFTCIDVNVKPQCVSCFVPFLFLFFLSFKGHAVKCKNLITEIMFQYVYPRLDVNVSTGVNHLLKSPFCIHPKTGRVCVPIDPNDAENFDPLIVPDIR